MPTAISPLAQVVAPLPPAASSVHPADALAPCSPVSGSTTASQVVRSVSWPVS
ncbi:hypothetical protein [Streptomyces iranensis]|uniref:Uncharacterized protein n=1 Tax=Streptomyces iranensis TaxID=576784 RepID=A0A061A187_9ACTN|nr:hypothetical protein [Streptomyces iranensis]MBP2068220.1 hypothetical protein [Streptomyces iranensis]CDR09139.1 predicted protein [Streptomyces iranensis]